eukprot:scaffold330595_cov54-Attheya_sp.AAC.3
MKSRLPKRTSDTLERAFLLALFKSEIVIRSLKFQSTSGMIYKSMRCELGQRDCGNSRHARYENDARLTPSVLLNVCCHSRYCEGEKAKPNHHNLIANIERNEHKVYNMKNSTFSIGPSSEVQHNNPYRNQ